MTYLCLYAMMSCLLDLFDTIERDVFKPFRNALYRHPNAGLAQRTFDVRGFDSRAGYNGSYAGFSLLLTSTQFPGASSCFYSKKANYERRKTVDSNQQRGVGSDLVFA